MSGWTWFWIGWAVLGGVVELIALLNNRSSDTASESVWKITKPFSSKPANAAVWVGRVVFILFGCWLGVHFGLGWLST